MSARQQALEKVAFQLGMNFSATDEWGLKTLLRDFKLFKRGGRRKILNMMQHQSALNEMDIRIFDYQFTVSTGNSSRTFKQTVFFVESKKLGLPQFLMKPENFLHRIAAYLGFEDIDFEEYPKFSTQYYLKGEDEDYIRGTLNDDFLKFFSIERNWYLEGLNYYLIFYKFNKLLPPTNIKDFHRKGLKLIEILEQDPFV